MAHSEIDYQNRNQKVLASFVAYCEAYPQLRFWQALLNWSRQKYIFVATEQPIIRNESVIWRAHEISDTYAWEWRTGEPDEEP